MWIEEAANMDQGNYQFEARTGLPQSCYSYPFNIDVALDF